MKPPVDMLLYLTDSGALQQGSTAHREARALQANALVIGRPSLFVPGQEAIRVEAVATQNLGSSIVRVQTPLGDFAIRQTDAFNGDGGKTERGGGTERGGTAERGGAAERGERADGAGKASTRLIPGQKIIMTISPSGTSAKIEVLPQQSTGIGDGTARPSPAMLSIAGSSTPTPNPMPALGQTRGVNLDQAVRGISQFEASAIGSEKRTELWLQSNLEAKGGKGGADAQRSLDITRAFSDAQSLATPSAASRIAASFQNLQTYDEVANALAGINPAVIEGGLRIAPRLNSTFGFALMFFLLTLRGGGLRAWLGQLGTRDVDFQDADQVFDFLDRHVGPRMRDLGRYGFWEVVLVPVMMKSLTQMVWAVKHEGVDPATGLRKPGQQCALQMMLPICGPLQLTALLYGSNLNITILTTTVLPEFLRNDIQANAPGCFGRFALRGNVAFTNKTSFWLPLLEGEIVNSLL